MSIKKETTYVKMVTKLEENWGNILKTHDGHCPIGKWVGVYIRNSLVCKALPNFKSKCKAFTQQLSIPKEEVLYSIGMQSKT